MMKIIRREALISDTDIILFDILKNQIDILAELKKLNGIAQSPLPPVGEFNGIIDNSLPLMQKDLYPCKYCGGGHEVRQQIAVCAKKNKKEGAK